MAGLEFVLSYKDLGAEKAIGRMASIDEDALLDTLGAVGVSQTQRRIESEKAGPDGTPWQAWSKGYASDRTGGQSLLMSEGNLVTSIDHDTRGGEVAWGSPLVYAAVQQFGATITPKNAKALAFTIGSTLVLAKSVTVPARPYLGLSADNRSEMEETALQFIAGGAR